MTLVEHLTELRRRIFISLLAVTVGGVVGFILTPSVIRILKAPIAQPLYFTSPGGALFLQLKMALLIGIAIAAPVVLYQALGVRFAGTDARRASLVPAVGPALAPVHGSRHRRCVHHASARRPASCSALRFQASSSR